MDVKVLKRSLVKNDIERLPPKQLTVLTSLSPLQHSITPVLQYSVC